MMASGSESSSSPCAAHLTWGRGNGLGQGGPCVPIRVACGIWALLEFSCYCRFQAQKTQAAFPGACAQ